MTIHPGNPYPLGAFWDGKGVNFALYSHNATGVELCLFHVAKGEKEVARIKLSERSHDIWQDSLYGYKIGEDDLSFGETDDAELASKSAVIDHHFDWEDDKAPKIAYHNTIIYEAHVKGLTKLFPGYRKK